MSARFASPRHIRVWVWSSHGAHHWRVRDAVAEAGGRCEDRDSAWACALSAMRGAIRLRQLHDAIGEHARRSRLR